MSLSLSWGDFDPRFIIPHGDRLLVEIIEIEDAGSTGTGLFVAAPARYDAKGNETDEYKRGFCAGVVLNVGDGHVLTTGSTLAVVPLQTNISAEDAAKGLPPNMIAYDPDTQQGVFATNAHPVVPMPFARGDVVLIERLAKREMLIGGRTYASVDQMDILQTVRNVKFTYDEKTLTWTKGSAQAAADSLNALISQMHAQNPPQPQTSTTSEETVPCEETPA